MVYDQGLNNKKDYKKSTNTRSLQFMNSEDCVYQSTLQLGWWDTFLTLSISPALGESERQNGKMFNYSINLNTALSPEKLCLLETIIDKEIRPAMDNNSVVRRGISIAGNSLLVIGTRSVDGKAYPYLAMFKNIDPETKRPENQLGYTFKQTIQVIDDYNEVDGTFTSHNIDGSEFELFYKIIKAAQTDLAMGSAHSIRYSDRYYNSNMKDTVVGIANKVGSDTPFKTGTQARGSYSGSNIFASTSNTTSDSDTMEEVDGLDSIPF